MVGVVVNNAVCCKQEQKVMFSWLTELLTWQHQPAISHMWAASNKTVLARPMEGRRALKIRQSHSRESLTRHSGSFPESAVEIEENLPSLYDLCLLAVGYLTFQSHPMLWRPLSHIGHQCGLSIHWYYECGLSTFTPSGLSVWKGDGH